MAYSSETTPLIADAPPGGQRASPATTAPKFYSPFVTYCMTINFILGAGVLGVPHAFFVGGPALGAIILILVTIVAATTMTYLVDLQARANAVSTHERRTQSESESKSAASRDPKLSSSSDNGGTHYNSSIHGSDLDRKLDRTLASSVNLVVDMGAESLSDSEDEGNDYGGGMIGGPDFRIRPNRVFEVNAMSELFLGQWGLRLWELSIFGYSYGALWLYGTVFANTLVNVIHLPHLGQHHDCSLIPTTGGFGDDCVHGYMLYLGIFALIMVPLAFRDLADQARIQQFMTIYGMVAIVVMILTVSVALGQGKHMEPYVAPKAFDFSGFGVVFTAALFSQVGHMGAPGLTHLLKDKKRSKSVFMTALTTTGIMYILLGILLSTFFGINIKKIATLNWVEYTGEQLNNGPWWAQILKYIVILWPAVSVSAVYALYAVTLANNLTRTIKQVFRVKREKVLKYGCRLFTSFPPMLLALFMRDAGTVITYSGLFGFSIGFIYPTILYHFARRRCVQIWGRAGERTPYTWFMMHPIVWWVISVFWFGSLVYSIYGLAAA